MPSAAQYWTPLAASAAVLALAYGPLLLAFFRNQWERPQYQFFPFVLAAFGWLLWRSCSQSSSRSEGERSDRRFPRVALIVGAWALLALACVANSPWLAMVSAILLVASLFTRVSGTWQVEYLWGIWAMLLLLVPLPLNRDQALINRLQHLSSRVSSFFLDWLGVHHLMDGNALRLPDKEFFVDEACSGIVSVMSVIACAAIYGVWRNRPPVHVVLLAVAGVVWATLMNVGRITTIAVAYAWWGVDWSSGTQHEVLGLIAFTITFLALVSTDYLLVALLAPISQAGDDPIGQPIQYGSWLAATWDRLQAWGAPRSETRAAASAAPARSHRELWHRFALGLIPMAAFGALAIGQFAVTRLLAAGQASSPQRITRALELAEPDMPARIGTLQRVGFETQERTRDDISGQYSRLYRYADVDGNEFILSCDFPFGPHWHDLTVCYRGVGWTQTDAGIVRSAVAARSGDLDDWQFVEVGFTRPDGSSGLLVYCAFDDFGTCLVPPGNSLIGDVLLSLRRQYGTLRTGQIFQIQVWVTAVGNVKESQAAQARELLLAAREQIRNFILNQPPH